MRRQINFVAILLLVIVVCSCGKNKRADAYGSFEAEEIILSSQIDGQLLDFVVKQGERVEEGEYIASIDSTQLVFQRIQVNVQLEALKAQYTIMPKKFIQLEDSLMEVENEIWSITNKANGNQEVRELMDSLISQKEDIEKAISDWKDDQSAQVKVLSAQFEQLYIQLRQLNNAIIKCRLISPKTGVLLAQYVNQYELVGKGYPVAKIADIDNMTLKAYVSEKQLSSIQLGQKCTVRVDKEKKKGKDKKKLKTYEGVIYWISDQSEFTPKMIQTKDERVNLVYAVKVRVKNDSSIKIGMPGEVKF